MSFLRGMFNRNSKTDNDVPVAKAEDNGFDSEVNDGPKFGRRKRATSNDEGEGEQKPVGTPRPARDASDDEGDTTEDSLSSKDATKSDNLDALSEVPASQSELNGAGKEMPTADLVIDGEADDAGLFEDEAEDLTKLFDMADVTFVVQERRIYHVRSVLAYHSARFKEMLLGQKTDHSKEVQIKDCNFVDFLALLKLLKAPQNNSGKEIIRNANVEKLLELAALYQLPMVTMLCQNFILTNWKFNDDRIVEAVRLAAKFGLHIALRDLLTQPCDEYPSLIKDMNIEQLLAIAKEYQLESVKDKCEKYLLQNWKQDACKIVGAVELSAKFGLEKALANLVNANASAMTDGNVEQLLELCLKYSLFNIRGDCEQYILNSWINRPEKALRAVELAHKMNLPTLAKTFIPLAAKRPLGEIDASMKTLSAELYAAVLHCFGLRHSRADIYVRTHEADRRYDDLRDSAYCEECGYNRCRCNDPVIDEMIARPGAFSSKSGEEDNSVLFEIPARAGSELKISPPKTGSVFGQGFGASALSFEQLSQTPVVDWKPLTTSDKLGGFAGAGSTLFASNLSKFNKGKENAASADGGNVDADGSPGESLLRPEEFVPSIEFKPAIPLPSLIDVRTGEESEEIKFCEKAKLYRFDDTTGEFKERGAGDLKILYDRTANRHRVVMRREQVLKLCANHILTSAMKLLPMAKSDKAFTWICQDFSDGALQPETLAARLKTREIALRFKEHFEAAVQTAAVAPTAVTGRKDNPPRAKKSDVAAAGFGGAQFLPKPGSWECSACYIRNTAGKLCCDCCGTAKDGAPVVASSSKSTSHGIFKAMPATTAASTLRSSPFKFSFGSTPLSTVGSSKLASASGPQPALSLGFASNGLPTPHSATAAAAEHGKPLLTTTLAFAESSNSQHAVADRGDEGANELYADDGAGDHIHFEPLLSLPLQDVKSGEEEEDILYRQRAKLFRFYEGEWKERGVGEFKLLKHRETDKIRALMRRDQTLKVCCNHLVTPQMVVAQRANDNRCYIWTALDFSENCEAAETFAIRFQNEQLASEFRSAFETAKSSVSHSSVRDKFTSGSAATAPSGENGDGKEPAARTLGRNSDCKKTATAAPTETKEIDSSSSNGDLCADFEKRATLLILEDKQLKGLVDCMPASASCIPSSASAGLDNVSLQQSF